MTRTDLEEYHNISVRLKILKTTIVTDSVVGSSADYPYVAHSITLHGVHCDDETIKEISALEHKKAEMDAYIDCVMDTRAHLLLDMHYRKNRSWARISAETGYSVDSNKKYLQRFFVCPHVSP